VPDYTGPKRVAGYRILRELGAGGMGTVYEAHDEKMERDVALKILSRSVSSSGKAEQRFEQEAWIAGKLSHPNLVKVYERGHWEELSYFSMELVDGGSLNDVISNMRRWGRDDRWNLEFGSREYIHWAITQIIAAANGLDYAHRQGVIHRDVKPMNLLLSREMGEVKIADFGLAIDAEMSRLTTDGSILGTLSYMAPEQILGKQNEIDARTDIYALGVTLFELLTLALPFSGQTQQLYLNAVLTAEAQRPSKLNDKVGRDLEIVVRKALEKESKDRYSSAAAFAEDLQNVLHFRPIRAQPPKLPTRIWKWVRRKPVHAALLAALLVGVPTVTLLAGRAVKHRRLQSEVALASLKKEVRLLRQDEDYQGIVDLTSRQLEIDPQYEAARLDRSLAYMDMARAAGEGAERDRLELSALADIDRLAEQLPDKQWPERLRAFILAELGHQQEGPPPVAVDRDASVARDDEDLYFDGFLAVQSGDYELGAEILSDLILKRPGSTDLLHFRAEAYTNLERYDDALQDYRLSAVLQPEDFYHYYMMGTLKMGLGETDEAETFLGRALELAPGNAAILEKLSENRNLGGLREALDDNSPAALELYRQSEQAARQGIEADPRRPWLHINLGASLMEQNRILGTMDEALIQEAVHHYREALSLGRESIDPRSAAAVTAATHNLCDALIQSTDYEKALEGCREGVLLNPDDAVNHYNLAGVYALLNRPDEALLALERDFELGDYDYEYLLADPWFQSIREDPRFVALVERMRAAAAEL